MKRMICFGALSTALLLALFAGPLAADPPQELRGGDAQEQRERNPLREYIRLNMELGQFYLLSGSYDLAAERFLTVARFDMPGDADRSERRARRSERSDQGAESGREGRFERRERRRHRRQDPRQVQQQAFLNAAIATYLMGDTATAIAIAEDGLQQLPGRGAAEEAPEDRRRRAPGAALERFIQEPDALAERVATGPQGIEARLLEIEAQLGENGAQ